MDPERTSTPIKQLDPSLLGPFASLTRNARSTYRDGGGRVGFPSRFDSAIGLKGYLKDKTVYLNYGASPATTLTPYAQYEISNRFVTTPHAGVDNKMLEIVTAHGVDPRHRTWYVAATRTGMRPRRL